MTTTEALQQTRILVQTAAEVCEEKKGEDTRILELDPIDSGLSDFFLVTSASNDRQAIAIADEIEHRLKKEFGVYPNSVEGRRQGDWVLLDYVDFVVHVFLTERRAFYDIERPAQVGPEISLTPGRVRLRVESCAGSQDPGGSREGRRTQSEKGCQEAARRCKKGGCEEDIVNCIRRSKASGPKRKQQGLTGYLCPQHADIFALDSLLKTERAPIAGARSYAVVPALPERVRK